MQTMGATGKIYGLKSSTTQNGKAKVTFRLGTRKEFVSEQDKQNNNTNVFLPMIAYGKTAEFIQTYFKDGDGIELGNLEYQTFRTQNAPNQYDDAHIFNVGKASFPVGSQSNGGGQGQQAPQQNNFQQQGYQQGYQQQPAYSQQQPPAQAPNFQQAPPQQTAVAAQTVPSESPFTSNYNADDDLPF